MILSLIWIIATFILLFISEKPFQNLKYLNKIQGNESNNISGSTKENNGNENTESDAEEPVLSISETFFKIKNAFKNQNLRGFIGILLISKIGQIFSFKLTGLILIEKGYPQENLTNLSTIMNLVEIIISFKLSNIKADFLKHYLNSYRKLFFVFGYELLILMAYENYKAVIDEYMFTFSAILLIHNIIKTYLILISFISVCGFFYKITDRSIGATYITALNSSKNLSEKWPAIFIFYLVDIINYKIIGVVSIIYSIGFYLTFKNKLEHFDQTDEAEWLSVKHTKETKSD